MVVKLWVNIVNLILLSGQIIIFHQPRFPWNKGISLTKTTIWGEVVWGRYNLTRPMGMINTPLLSSQHPHRHRPTCRQLELCLVTVTGFTEWTAKMPWGHWVSNPKRSKGGVEDPKNLGFSKFSADILKKNESMPVFFGRKHPEIWRIDATFKDGIILGIYLLCFFVLG